MKNENFIASGEQTGAMYFETILGVGENSMNNLKASRDTLRI